MQIRSITTALVALSATALLLTGCSQQPTDTTAKKPSASASSPAPDGIEKPPYDNACDGKQAVISGNGGTHKIEDCEAVAVAASGSDITLGTTKDLMVEGSNNVITLSEAEHVTLLGSNNKVTVQDGSPEVDDQGTGNVVD